MMGKLIVYLLLGSSSLASIVNPWVGVIAAYSLVIFSAQARWFWMFGSGVRPVYLILLPTIIGLILSTLMRKIDYEQLKTNQNLWLAVILIFFNLSYLLGSHVDIQSEWYFNSPADIITTANKLFALYFIGALCLDTEKKLKLAIIIIIAAVIYYTYWINVEYLTKGLLNGRIGGPTDTFGGGQYRDENIFGVLFVIGIPFIFYMGKAFVNPIFRYACWMCIPLCWHGVFLTGSRGALLGLSLHLVIYMVRSPRKLFPVMLLLVFGAVFMWQGGEVMINRANTISSYEEDASAMGRINAWAVAIKMAENHPITGVGVASFGAAYSDYGADKPHEAHNTFFQILGESGVIAAFAYAMLCLGVIRKLWKRGTMLSKKELDIGDHRYLINEAILMSFASCVFCGIFLSLQIFEVFYFLCLLVHVYFRIFPSFETASALK